MARTFHFRIVTREGLKYDGLATYARLHAQDGYFGVMADHAPLIAALCPGDLLVTEPGKPYPTIFAAGAGVVEIRENEVAALVETAELAADIDIVRATEAVSRARARLAETRDGGVDVARAEAALARALARLHASERAGRREGG